MSFSALASAGLVIQIHVFFAILAMLVGPFVLLRKRRDITHKTFGYIWVVAMGVTALSSFFIFEIRLIGPFSPIHGLSVLTIFTLFVAIKRIRQKDVAGHKKSMWRLYYQAIGLAGIFSFLPSRIMNETFSFASDWVIFFGAVCVFSSVGIIVYLRLRNQLQS